jgi:hypothetical protein
MLKAKRKVITAKIEAVYGTDSAPAVGTDAMLVHNFSATPKQMRYVERDPALPFFGNDGMIKVGETMQMQFDVEVAGAGAVADVPKFAPLLRGCALAETITPITGPVTYDPITSAEESLSVYFYWDGLLHKMLGARGSIGWVFSAGQIPMKRFTFEGLYGGVTDVALPVPTLTGWQRPQAVNKANTTFSLHGYTAVLRELSVNQGNVMQYVNAPNSEQIRFIDRKTRGSVTIEMPLIAGKNFFSIIDTETVAALALVHGTTAGNKALFDAGQVQLTNPSYSEGDGTAILQMGLEFRPTAAGNDEFSYATQ